jgi:hypothetical protein
VFEEIKIKPNIISRFDDNMTKFIGSENQSITDYVDKKEYIIKNVHY